MHKLNINTFLQLTKKFGDNLNISLLNNEQITDTQESAHNLEEDLLLLQKTLNNIKPSQHANKEDFSKICVDLHIHLIRVLGDIETIYQTLISAAQKHKEKSKIYKIDGYQKD